MTDRPIPDEIAIRFAKLINAAEDMRQQAADDLKTIYADLRDDLKALGWGGKEISAELAGFKGAIAELRLDEQAKAKREAKGDRIDVYADLLRLAGARARIREGQSYADQKGRGETVEVPPFVAVTSSGAEYRYDAETGEIIENHNEGEDQHGTADGGQRVGRADGEQRGQTPVPGADRRGEGADDGDQGQGAGASGADRFLRPVAGTVDREDEDRGSRHVGGEVDHEVTQSDSDEFVAVKAQGRLANVDDVEPSQSEPEATGLAPRATLSPDPQPSQADGGQPQTSNDAGAKSDGRQAIVGRAPTGETEDGQFEEQQASAAQDRNKPVSASGAAATHSEPFEPPAFLRGEKVGCLKLRDGHCKLTNQPTALCSDCRQADLRARAAA